METVDLSLSNYHISGVTFDQLLDLLAVLNTLPKPCRLSLSAYDARMSSFLRLSPHLVSLTIDYADLSEDTIASSLPALSRLESVSFLNVTNNASVVRAIYPALRPLPNLTRFTLTLDDYSRESQPDYLAGVESLASLRALSFVDRSSRLSLRDAQKIVHALPLLEELETAVPENEQAVRCLASLTHLRKLTVREYRLTYSGVSRPLRVVDWFGCFAAHPNLEELVLQHKDTEGDTYEAFLQQVLRMPRIRRLTVPCELSAADLAMLARAPCLQSVTHKIIEKRYGFFTLITVDLCSR